jgi:hypothetical protein
LIDLFKFKFDRLNTNLTVFYCLRSKIFENNSKIFKFHTPSTYRLRSKKFLKSKKFKTSHLFYVLYFNFLYNYFLKFVIHKINFEIVKFKMILLTEKEKTDVVNADMTVS